MIFFFLVPAYFFVNLYLYLRSLAWLESLSPYFGSLWFLGPYTFLYLFLSTSLLTAFVLSPSKIQSAIKRISNYWLGALCYIVLFSLSAEILFFVLKNLPIFPDFVSHSPVLFSAVGGAALFLIAVFCLYGIFHARKIREVTYSVSLEKPFPEKNTLTIAFMADLHLGSGCGLSHVKKLVRLIRRRKPDLFLIGGDIFDNQYDDIQNPEEIIRCLKTISCPYGSYACYGNHDISEKILGGFTFRRHEQKSSDPRMDQFLEKSGIRLLRDEVVCLKEQLFLAGRRDCSVPGNPEQKRLSARELLEKADTTKPVIVLDHQPGDLTQLSLWGADLVLSGHTHGGQMFPANVPVRLTWQNAYGQKSIGAMCSIVTSGAGIWGPGMRVGTQTELVWVKVSFNNLSASCHRKK